MNGFLLDTNVLSEFGRSTRVPDANVKAWLTAARPEMLFTSVLSFGEIRKGIELLPQGRKRAELEQWTETGLPAWFGDNMLPVTKAICHRWGVLDALAQKHGRLVGNIDGLIAATALEHKLTVVTRNTKHFAPFGTAVLDPWRV